MYKYKDHIDGLTEYTLTFETLALAGGALEEVEDKFVVKPAIFVYGKLCHQQRNVLFCSNVASGYFYSGAVQRATPMGPALTELMQKVNEACLRPDGSPGRFNAALFNQYVGGDNYISQHADDESGLDADAPDVVAISLGATRTFRITRNVPGKVQHVIDVPARTGRALRMHGSDFQKKYKHGVPIEKKVRGTRTSITFRYHDPDKDRQLLAQFEANQAKKAAEQAAAQPAAGNKRPREDE